MDINATGNNKLLLKYAMKDDKKEEIFHSSGYARAQAGANFGAAGGGGETFSARKNIDADRKYIQGYKNSRITNEYRSLERAKAMASSAVSSINSHTDSRGATNPMDTAMARAKQTASEPRGFGIRGIGAGGGVAGATSTPRAPKIPMRRSGI